jgi:electron transport complex protein RnfB
MASDINNPPADRSRRSLLGDAIRAGLLLGLGGTVALLAKNARGAAAGHTVWQIDPAKCIQCGKCATNCVLNPSAVKCVHNYELCGYCDLCTGYFEAQPNALNTAAENQLCPTAAIERKWVEDRFFEYNIKTDLCIGCGKCVMGCSSLGNGSLQLQINQKLCVRCNQCSIAAACPAQAISRIPSDQPYLLKTKTRAS